MPLYESVFIARQDIAAPQVDSLADNFQQVIEGQGGNVAKREYWGLRTLSYKIKKNRKGHYVLMNIEAPAEAMHEVERQMRIHDDVLRYLTIRVDEHEEGPSAILRNKGSEDRPRRGRDGDGRDRKAAGADDGADKPKSAEKTEETKDEGEES